MKLFYLSVTLILGLGTAAAQNLNFEQVNHQTRQPAGWWSAADNGYQVTADSVIQHEGRYALRIQSEGKRQSEKVFGVATIRVPVDFQGKVVKLTGFLKTENVEGYAGLWLRVDGAQSTLAFQNTSKENVHGTTDWQAYTITLPLDNDARFLLLGGILPGTGTAWIDQLELTVDDKPLAQAPPKTVQRFKAEQDTAFQRGAGITLDNLSKQQVENLAVLGRVWGFVKYYHPAVARGDYNWDAELLRVLPKVLTSENQKARSEVLGAWLASLGPVPACTTCKEPTSPTIRLQPDLAWLTNKKQLGQELSKQLVYLRENRNQGDHYYVQSAPQIGNPIFRNEENYASLQIPDAGLRLLALYRYWNMIAYFFPYRYAIGEDWQQVLSDMIPQFAAATTAEQYHLTALKLIARIHDTHANIYSDKILNDYQGRYFAPVRIRFVESQAVVTEYYSATLGKESGLEAGDVIVQVNGVPVPELVKKWQPLAPASNEPTQLRNIANLLLRGSTDKLPLLVRRHDKEFALTISRYYASKLNLAVNSGTASPLLPAWRMLPNNIGYISLGTIHNKQLPEIMQSVAGTQGLVIDIRNYPSEFVVFSLSKYLLPKAMEFVKISKPLMTYPGVFEYIPSFKLAAGTGTPYAGKIVILVNELSQSQAEYTTMALRTAPSAMVVGSTTAGADGNVSRIVLPGNISTMISGLGIYYPDGRETQRIGIVPDVEVKPTIQGIREGRDEVLEKAVQLIEKGR
ncbi:S41 family peptidase [uncultured Hymenobacter sp.]|uniref:S41 family peptidase n=1 Tax=uncultured Hymenobacter sp. TaxID=170016 RepID=UPI0035C9A6F4